MALAKLGLEQSLGVADAAEPEVADIRLAGHEGHRHSVAELAPAQVRVDDHREFVCRPEAARALDGADDDRSGIGQEGLVRAPRLLRVRGRADALRVRLRAEPGDFVEGELRSRRDHEIVVFKGGAAREHETIGFRLDPVRRIREEADAFLLDVGPDRNRDLSRRPPADGDPGVGRRELEVLRGADERDLMGAAEALPEFISRRHAADACTDDDDVCHFPLSLRRCPHLHSMRHRSILDMS